MKYELISYTYSDKKCWTLFDTELATWPIFTVVYSALNRRYRASDTQRLTFTAQLVASFSKY